MKALLVLCFDIPSLIDVLNNLKVVLIMTFGLADLYFRHYLFICSNYDFRIGWNDPEPFFLLFCLVTPTFHCTLFNISKGKLLYLYPALHLTLNFIAYASVIYLEKCCFSKLEDAGECSSRAELYKRAAFAYAKGNLFCKCLAACTEGKIFETGLSYIRSWKQDATINNNMERYRDRIEATAQNFLENAARNYSKLKDYTSMLRFVNAFHAKDLIRTFWRNEDYFDELLQLEIDWGCFLNAANIAKQLGITLYAAELLEKAKHFEEASLVILFYVLANCLWTSRFGGWPLKQFPQKKELLDKARTLAKNVSAYFFWVCLHRGENFVR